MSQDQDPKESQRLSRDLGPSLIFIYFMIGMVLGVVVTMVTLSIVRPYLPVAGWVQGLVFAPLVIGGLIGFRTALLGARERIPLSVALRGALGLWRS